MISVGKYKVLHCISYLQMAGHDAHLDLEVFGGIANFRVQFLVAEEDGEKKKSKFGTGPDPEASDRGLFTFTNWNRKEFLATDEPVAIAIVNKRNLYLIHAVTYNNGLYYVRLQFMEDTSEQVSRGQTDD